MNFKLQYFTLALALPLAACGPSDGLDNDNYDGDQENDTTASAAPSPSPHHPPGSAAAREQPMITRILPRIGTSRQCTWTTRSMVSLRGNRVYRPCVPAAVLGQGNPPPTVWLVRG